MDELTAIANLILAELMEEDFIDPLCGPIENKEVLIDIIEDFWIHSGETGSILQNGWNLDEIITSEELLDRIIELSNEQFSLDE